MAAMTAAFLSESTWMLVYFPPALFGYVGAYVVLIVVHIALIVRSNLAEPFPLATTFACGAIQMLVGLVALMQYLWERMHLGKR